MRCSSHREPTGAYLLLGRQAKSTVPGSNRQRRTSRSQGFPGRRMSAEKSDLAAVRRPGGAVIPSGIGSQSQRRAGPDEFDVDVGIVLRLPVPHESDPIAVGGKRTAALTARITGERNRPQGFQGRFGRGQEVPHGHACDGQYNHRRSDAQGPGPTTRCPCAGRSVGVGPARATCKPECPAASRSWSAGIGRLPGPSRNP